MKLTNLFALLCCAMTGLCLTGCGGTIESSVGGTISGLSGGATVALLDNGADVLTVTAPSTSTASSTPISFAFGATIKAGTTYDVTIQKQPDGETCTVSNGVGTVQESIGNVTSIVVFCSATISAANDITGTVTGLVSGSITLLNNGTDPVTVFATGSGAASFVFPTPLPVGATYNVVVSANSSGKTCPVTPSGQTIPKTGNASVLVTCR